MAKSREHFALDWIKGELLETLNGAREALEAFVESDRDETRMRACLTGLHQVHGTLVMLELTGVTLLADHLEQLAQKMLGSDVGDEPGASQVLMQGILELPGHIEDLRAGAPDNARAVLKLVNEIRGYLGQAPIDLGGEVASIARGAPAEALTRFEDIHGADKTRKIRAAYQQVLLSILKGEDVSGSVEMLSKVSQGLQRVCQGTPHEQLWEAFGEFVVSLGRHQGPLDSASVKLLRRIDSEIRTLGQNGVSSLKEPVSLDLVGQLLDAASSRGHSSPATERLRQELDGGEADEAPVSPTGRQALSSAAAALREELLLVKDRLDLIVRAGGRSPNQLLELIAPLKQIGSTLSLLGFESSRTIVADQIETLNAAGDGEVLDQNMLMSIASALVQVDENLASFSHGGKNEAEKIVDEAARAVTVEARQGLDQVKQDVVDFISSEWDPRHLKETPGRIAAICGALDMIPLARASRLLAGCGRYVSSSLAQGYTPSWQEMDRFADAVSGLDYYLERIGEETSFGVDDVLDLVQRSLDGLAIEAAPGEVAAADSREQLPSEAAPVEAEGADLVEVEGADLVEVEEADLVEAEGADLEAAVEEDAVFAGAQSLETLPGDLEDEEEPALEMDDDPGFDLSDQNFDQLDASPGVVLDDEAGAEAAQDVEEAQPAVEVLLETPSEPAPSPAAGGGRIPKVDPSLVDSFESDAEIVEIFVEEVEEVLETVDEWLVVWRGDLSSEEALTEVRRSFHTLKGSGRIVGANVIGELAWSVENMLNRLIDGTVEPSEQYVSVVAEARTLVPVLKDAFETQTAPDLTGVGLVMEKADVLASGGSLDDAMPAEAGAAGAPTDLGGEEAGRAAPRDEVEDTLGIFLGEAEGHLAVLGAALDADGMILDENTVRALHTLSGSAGMAGYADIEDLARPTYELASVLFTGGGAVGSEAADYFSRAVHALAGSVEALRTGDEPEDHLQLIAEADHLIVAAGAEERVSDGLLIMALDGLSDIMEAHAFLESWKDGAMDLAYGDRLVEALTEVHDTALAHDVGPIADVARALAGALTRLADEQLDEAAFQGLSTGHERLLNLFDALAAEQSLPPVGEVVAMLDTLDIAASADLPQTFAEEVEPTHEEEAEPTFEGDDEAPIEMAEPGAEAGPEGEDYPGPGNIVAFPGDGRDRDDAADSDEISLDELEESLLGDLGGAAEHRRSGMEIAAGVDTPSRAEAEAEAESELEADALPELEVPPAAVSAAVAELLPEEVDDEIIEVFFEEADEILEGLEENIHRWSSEPDNRLYLEHMLRGLHTLKGGARLSGLGRLGDATHQFESFLIDVQGESDTLDDGFFDDLHGRYDGITNLLAVIRKALAGEPVTAPELDATEAGELPPPVEDSALEELVRSNRREGRSNVREIPVVTADSGSREEPAVEPRSGQEMVRVGSGLLEELVNLAGESSIVRARVEQGMSDFTGALDEMETTIDRLREQLRRLEIETEAQILFRQDLPDGPSYTEFDPLEMDRYSQLQQLSRGLSESASDMLDLKETLMFKARESETLLLQQARINTELQEGLMRTRMVPFSRLLPRLRRIVRQVSSELGKEVEFHAYNAEGELDRSLLERMVPPLEHMLRNAVDHGIEPAELRANFGKPGAGRIDLRLSREGGDVVIEISDDGAGIDVESVREKAVERGLMATGASLTDEEISQFVLAPGFSTAKSVTQISGRGVGMDVVHSEVKQLGGSIQIASRPGKGTRFIVRVPFTVSVNRALMVSVGDDFYAVPLNNIEGIVLLSPDELERLYAPDGNTFEYAGIPYRVRYLGHYLGREFRSSNQQSSVPVVLVRSGDHAVAVHVDGVQGSREIVVKSLGPQFAGVGGISGATILGDGNVVVILDLLALIRARGGEGLTKRPLTGAARTRCVMVVDDSVTVRKVTSRLLERQGMDVIVAKDGVEAVALLQERKPDVMLLDIEMPRMDGFEVARQVRHDERLADLPIVMISSRTGEKHQEHAAELGVNSFLGKPFQENELLATIDRLVD